MTKPLAVIVDIDGTIADASHRLHLIKGETKDWDAFYDAMVNDTPIEGAVGTILDELDKVVEDDTVPLHIMFVTGRRDTHRKETEEWLQTYCALADPGYYSLLMRADGDHRDDTVVKEELYDTHIAPNVEVVMAFEDRPRIIEMWERRGIKTVKMGEWTEVE